MDDREGKEANKGESNERKGAKGAMFDSSVTNALVQSLTCIRVPAIDVK